MKNPDEHAVIRVVIATGISSVVTQLVTIREFLTRFQGNEIVITLILFNWLILGGIGTLLARRIGRRFHRISANRLAVLSLALVALSQLQVLAIRLLWDVFFIPGVSVGFYPTLAYTFFIITPYCLLVGFVLPYSLFVLRSETPDFPGARIYITDNIGDVSGGALFSFALVFLVTPLQAVFIANLPLLVLAYRLFAKKIRRHLTVIGPTVLAAAVLVGALAAERPSLAPPHGKLALYRESRYGRITVHQDHEQYTLFEDGVPVFSSSNLVMAEEAVHYPLSQVNHPQNILVISAQGGMMAELKKYGLKTIDYVELDPAVAAIQFKFNLIEKIPALHVIYGDGRAFLAGTAKKYDAIIVNLPEPQTFQINRFYTDQFFRLAKNHLAPGGVLAFAMQGFENYLAEPQRRKLSSLYNTLRPYFSHVILLPGQKVFFLGTDHPLVSDIPAALARRHISTRYISRYFYGNLTVERIRRLNGLMDPKIPRNSDTAPYLMRVMFSQWFAKYGTSPTGFIVVLILLTLVYLARMHREEYVLFSTGGMTMGSEILIIFAFQIFFGYIYLQIGLIITVFLAGLLPGAWLGQRLRANAAAVLILADLVLIVLMVLLILALGRIGGRLPPVFFLAFGFAVSLACGFQFPAALQLGGGGNVAAARAFSADLIGAACGALFTSLLLIPYAGLLWAAAALIALKLTSLLVIGAYHGKSFKTSFPVL